MSFRSSRKKSPEEKLKRRIRKKVRNQSGFLKHAIVYFVLFMFFIAAAFVIRADDFVIPFLLLFSFWMTGLILHGLSAFVFNRIDSWEEAQYQKRLVEFGLQERLDDPDTDEDDSYLDLESFDRLRKKMDERWNEGDFV